MDVRFSFDALCTPVFWDCAHKLYAARHRVPSVPKAPRACKDSRLPSWRLRTRRLCCIPFVKPASALRAGSVLPIWRTLFDVVDRSPAGRDSKGNKARAPGACCTAPLMQSGALHGVLQAPHECAHCRAGTCLGH